MNDSVRHVNSQEYEAYCALIDERQALMQEHKEVDTSGLSLEDKVSLKREQKAAIEAINNKIYKASSPEEANKQINNLIVHIDSLLDKVSFERYMAILSALTTNLLHNSVTPKNLNIAREYLRLMQSEVLSILSDEGKWQ